MDPTNTEPQQPIVPSPSPAEVPTAASPIQQPVPATTPENQTSRLPLVALILAFLVPFIGVVLGIVTLINAKKNQTKKLLPVLAIVVGVIMIPVSVVLGLVILSHNVSVNINVDTSHSVVGDEKVASTVPLTEDEASKKIQTLSAQMVGALKTGDFVSAYGLTSSGFQATTSVSQANDAFLKLQPATQQDGFSAVSTACYKLDTGGDISGKTPAKFTDETLCGIAYGPKTTRADRTADYILFISNHEVNKFDIIRFQTFTSSNGKADLDKQAKAAMDQRVDDYYAYLKKQQKQ